MTFGRGPVFAIVVGASAEIIPFPTAWPDGIFANKVAWMTTRSYTGNVTVSGHRLDGPGEALFGYGVPPDMRSISWSVPGLNGNFEPSAAGVRAPGCYEWDVVGSRFSYKIVFNDYRRQDVIPEKTHLRSLIRWASRASVMVLLVLWLTPITAFAAMDANLSSYHARPGDPVLLLTDDHRGSWHYQALSDENHQLIYLSPTTADPAQACGGPNSQSVGRLTWRGNAAGLAFIVPNLPFGEYWVFMETSGQCWRLGGLGVSIELWIGTTAADNQDAAARWTVDSLSPAKAAPTHNATRIANATPSSTGPVLIVGGSILALLVAGILLRRKLLQSR